MSAASITAVSLQEYPDTVYEPYREYLGTELLGWNVDEWIHSRLRTLLSSFLFNQDGEWRVLVIDFLNAAPDC